MSNVGRQHITHTPCQRIGSVVSCQQAAGKVSKFISNNYVAINKPMPAIKVGLENGEAYHAGA